MIDLKRLGLLIGLGLMALGTLFGVARCAGREDPGVVQAAANAVRAHQAVVRAQGKADSLERAIPWLVAASDFAAAAHAQASLRADTAAAREATLRADALGHAADSAATVPELRGAIDSLARADSIMDARFVAERAAALVRIVAADSLAAIRQLTVEAKTVQLAALADQVDALTKELDAVKASRPGPVHRAFTGLEVGAATGVCTAVAWGLGGPVVGLAAGGVCALAAGIFAP